MNIALPGDRLSPSRPAALGTRRGTAARGVL